MNSIVVSHRYPFGTAFNQDSADRRYLPIDNSAHGLQVPVHVGTTETMTWLAAGWTIGSEAVSCPVQIYGGVTIAETLTAGATTLGNTEVQELTAGDTTLGDTGVQDLTVNNVNCADDLTVSGQASLQGAVHFHLYTRVRWGNAVGAYPNYGGRAMGDLGRLGGYMIFMGTEVYEEATAHGMQTIRFKDFKPLQFANYQAAVSSFDDLYNSSSSILFDFPGVYKMDIDWSFQTHPHVDGEDYDYSNDPFLNPPEGAHGADKIIYTFFTLNNMAGANFPKYGAPLFDIWATCPAAMDDLVTSIDDFPTTTKTGNWEYEPMQEGGHEDWSKYRIAYSGQSEDKVTISQSTTIEILDWSMMGAGLAFRYYGYDAEDLSTAGSGSGVTIRVTLTRIG